MEAILYRVVRKGGRGEMDEGGGREWGKRKRVEERRDRGGGEKTEGRKGDGNGQDWK